MKIPIQRNPLLSLLIIALCPIPFILFFAKEADTGSIIGGIIMLLIILMLLWALFHSYHEITSTHLIAVFGFTKIMIPLHEITSIRYTYNLLSAPAWTFKRVEITYSNYDIALISLPKDPDLFMKTMQEKCPLLNKNKI
ncbi:PH domain-containing protein [Bacillus sp. WLY-B-L8]|uniref:PH domain-containing protein n=1 Tax=Bacillus multifaciens TaxID=3068506 RepID=UPI00274047D2|nr:PH domain-containing protein [Bacillus sp. WLY-B-L8]MDP7979942.1 PH domain-containing protein [Bacillus sp. WLY-B-L8]